MAQLEYYNPFEHPSHASKNPRGLGTGPQKTGMLLEQRYTKFDRWLSQNY